MAGGMPSVIDLDAELAKLTMFLRSPHSTREDTKGSVARLASYRDGLLLALKSAGTDHWERHLTGDELVHVLDGSTTLEIVCDDGPPKSFTLGAGMIAVIPQGAWHRSHSEGNTQSYADSPALVDKGALGGNPFDNILGGQDRRHRAALPPLRRSPTESFERRP